MRCFVLKSRLSAIPIINLIFARIGGDGGLSPVQLYSADPGLMSNLGWDNNNQAVKKAQGLLL